MSNYTNHNLTQSDYKQCKYCTKYFIGSSSNRIYCSQSCQRERRKEYQRQISKQRYKQRRTCRHCGKISAVKNLYKSQCCFDKKCIELENDRKPQSGPIQKIKYKEKIHNPGHTRRTTEKEPEDCG